MSDTKISDKELQLQLLTEGINSKYFTQNVIARNPSLLFTGARKLIANALVKYYASNDILIDKQTLKEKVGVELDKLKRVKEQRGEEFTTAHVTQTYKIVNKLYMMSPTTNEGLLSDMERYVKDTLIRGALLQETANTDNTLANRVINRIKDIDDISITDTGNKAFDIFHDKETRTEIYTNGFQEDKVNSSFTPLDKLTGGLSKGQVAAIASSSGMFKTGTMTNLAYYYARSSHNVLYVSLEEKQEDMLVRFDRLAMNVDTREIFDEHGKVKPSFINNQENNYPNFTDKCHLVYKAERPDTITVERLKQIINNEERKNNLKFDVVFVDYADLLRNSSYSSNEALGGERLFQGLSKIAHECNVLLWTASQLNRTANSADVKTIDNVEGSYRKINICSLWLTINVNKDEREQGFIRYHIDKLRNLYGKKDDDFLYLKINQGTFKLEAETPDDMEVHKQLTDNTRRNPIKEQVKKEDSDESMSDIINKALSN